ncbi:myricetin 3-O-glucosyl 1,2-rhamnoside 6'-O-caffeoyltransferase AT1-like [Curcuma longa]|uniref:myricetin 3-O-glucosyl 1,2-rhamnoside 6'-O-caffeoyltransferase AT1-like n=1 Tax=Curcuma longa TaxID=136217 RepID=UPI003D9DB7F2
MSTASWVMKVAEELVAPCEPTPCATLPLSSIDHALELVFMVMVEIISVYPNNNREHRLHGMSLSAAKVIREALAKALVLYYPVAGHLVSSDGDHVEVACNDEGVWFVEAMAADYNLGDMNIND